jgi:hypothetical protein
MSFAHISVRRSFEDSTIEVDVGTHYNDDQARPNHYWFRRRLMSTTSGVQVYAYTNTVACPAALAPLYRLEHLHMPQPDVLNFGRELRVLVTDGALYRLDGRGVYAGGQVGEYSIESNVGTSLSRWVDSLLAVLQPCWAATAIP